MHRWAIATGLACLAVIGGGLLHIAAETNCEDFTARSAPRLYDVDFVENLLAQDGYPQHILDEGFHDLPEPLQRMLVDCLADALMEEDPLPPGTTGKQEQEVRDLVFLLIFDKESLPPVVTEDISPPVPEIGEPDSVVPEEAQEAIESLSVPTIPPGSQEPPTPLPEPEGSAAPDGR